jgi:hypothetical protein
MRSGDDVHADVDLYDWGKLLDDTAAVTALPDRLLHHAHVLKRGSRGAGGRRCSSRTSPATDAKAMISNHAIRSLLRISTHTNATVAPLPWRGPDVRRYWYEVVSL